MGGLSSLSGVPQEQGQVAPGAADTPNSETGNAILQKTLQGSFSQGSKHSLSGTEYSDAFIMNCEVLTSLITENMPRETERTRSHVG